MDIEIETVWESDENRHQTDQKPTAKRHGNDREGCADEREVEEPAVGAWPSGETMTMDSPDGHRSPPFHDVSLMFGDNQVTVQSR